MDSSVEIYLTIIFSKVICNSVVIKLMSLNVGLGLIFRKAKTSLNIPVCTSIFDLLQIRFVSSACRLQNND